MFNIRMQLIRISIRLTRFVGYYWGEKFPFYYVTEYPKSGGSWLANMIADYLQIPRPGHYVLPLGFQAVLHNHWRYSPRLRRVFYLYRDGRDVVVSDYFYTNRLYDNAPDASMRRYFARRFPRTLAAGVDRADCRRSLPTFIEDWAERRHSSLPTWAEHVSQWAFDRPHVVTLSYEDLLADCAGTLGRVIAHHTGTEVDPERIEWTVKKFAFAKQTGRAAGMEDRSSFKRKGVAGDWKNHFGRKAGEVFDRYCGDLLVRLGYEKTRDWYKDLAQ